MNLEQKFIVLREPHTSEKSTILADKLKQYAFKVSTDATKLEIKNEKLDEGLINLSTKLYPEYFNAEKVSEYMHSNSKVNESKISKYEIDSLSDKTLECLHHKESLLISRY